MKYRLAASIAISGLMFCATARGALINEYEFSNASGRDTAGTLDLTPVGSGGVYAAGFVTLDSSSANYLATSAYGGAAFPEFTVSLWVRAHSTTQGSFKGLFSNNDGGSNTPWSWQLDSHSGAYRTASQPGVAITSAEPPTAGVWQNLVVRKSSSSQAELYVNGVLAGSSSANLGNLDSFRLGVNRTGDAAYAADYDGLQIWNSAEDPVAIYNAGSHRITKAPAHSWIAGASADLHGAAGVWDAASGNVNWTFDGAPTLTPVADARYPGIPAAYAFPDSQAKIASISNSLFATSGDGSLELWFKPSDLSGNHILFEAGGDGNGTALALVGDELRFVSQTSGNQRVTTSATLGLGALDAWNQVVGVINNPNDGSIQLSLYLNSELIEVASLPAGSGFNSWSGINGPGLGMINNTAAGGLSGITNFDGWIAIFNHYDFALSGGDVSQLYHTVSTIPEPATFWLLAAGGSVALIAARRRRRED